MVGDWESAKTSCLQEVSPFMICPNAHIRTLKENVGKKYIKLSQIFFSATDLNTEIIMKSPWISKEP